MLIPLGDVQALVAEVAKNTAGNGSGLALSAELANEAICGPKSQMLLDRSHVWRCCPNRKKWVLAHFQDKDPCGLKPTECAHGSTRNPITGECLRSDAQCGPEPSNVGVMESPQHRAWRACRAQGPVTPVRGTEKVSAATIVTGAVVAASLGLALWISLKD